MLDAAEECCGNLAGGIPNEKLLAEPLAAWLTCRDQPDNEAGRGMCSKGLLDGDQDKGDSL